MARVCQIVLGGSSEVLFTGKAIGLKVAVQRTSQSSWWVSWTSSKGIWRETDPFQKLLELLKIICV